MWQVSLLLLLAEGGTLKALHRHPHEHRGQCWLHGCLCL